jgi:uncharacterized protein
MPSLAEDLTPSGVKRIETHISWVFLHETEVYKVKKPVDLGFLDFRTLELRRAACDAEVRLNRRLAPGTYLGVVPIVLDETGRHQIAETNTTHDVVDWAVKMVRLSNDDRADKLLNQGKLDAPFVAAIAETLAAFHANAESSDAISQYGSTEAIARNVRENFDQMRATVNDFISPADEAEIEKHQLGFLNEHHAWFDARIATGRVRDGHGDLRLEHVYLRDAAAPTIIDCIEFNDRFRYGDVCADIAFLSMDMASQGRKDLAERFLAKYAQASNDFDLYRLVDFYEGYRAYVRGKVSAMLAADHSAPPQVRLAAEQSARHHFLVALAAQRAPLARPRLIAVGGIIGCGKSTVARWLGGTLLAPVIESDRTRKHLKGVDALAPLASASFSGAYSADNTEQVYAEVLRKAAAVLGSGRSVIVDATFRSETHRQDVHALSEEFNIPFLFVECQADAEICRARLEKRDGKKTTSDGRATLLDEFIAKWEPVRGLPAAEHVVIDTSGPKPETEATLEKALAARRLDEGEWT